MIFKKSLTLISLVLVATLSGCTLTPTADTGADAVPLSNKISLSNERAVTSHLYSQLYSWKGTPYKLGGKSKSGIDCSAFVQNTYRTKLGYQLPRSTEAMAETGKEVDLSELKAGDLVFFKTGIKTNHVGVYLEKGKFMHASTSKGVMMSAMDNDYWKDVFWQARRVVN
ncbi:MAG: NlpC/P60 family protein [Colwellia sp.]